MPITNQQFEPAKTASLPDRFGFLGVFSLAMFSCWLLALAYPEGLINEETYTYWLLQKNFQWFAVNQFDWYRTIPYAALLGFCSHFPNPTNTLYWFNSLLFSLDCALLFVLGKLIFSSTWKALTLAVAMVLFEVVSMRIFYNNLGMSPDAPFGELICLGSLLGLIGWMKHRQSIFLLACLIFGLVAFSKPAGMALWTVWIPLAICFFFRLPLNSQQKVLSICTATLFMTGPIALWSLRNYCIYGYAKTSGMGQSMLLERVLPLMSDDDQLLDDPHMNADFHLAHRECQGECLYCFRFYDLPYNLNLEKTLRFEASFLYGPARANAFQILAQMTDPHWRRTDCQLVDLQPQHMFKMDAESGRIATRIISLHPFEYTQQVLDEYTWLFKPLEVWSNPLYSFQSNPSIAYNYWDTQRQGERKKYPELYAGKNFPTGTNSNLYVARALGILHDNFLVRALLTTYYALEFLISHLVFSFAVILFVLSLKYPKRFANALSTNRISLTLVVLFLTVASNFMMTASVQITRLRYQLAGDMILHAMFLIALIAGTSLVVEKISSLRISSWFRQLGSVRF